VSVCVCMCVYVCVCVCMEGGVVYIVCCLLSDVGIGQELHRAGAVEAS
jgi:hypothetical protein